jgi:signal transduction histidine kinase
VAEALQAEEQLAALASHLAARRDAILEAWRKAVEGDPELATASVLSRAQFNDHIPEVLDALGQTIAAGGRAKPVKEYRENAAGHGMHRWQQGYDQRDVMREWRHLHLCLVDELENYSLSHPMAEAGIMPKARRALALLCSDGVCESAAQYAHLQRIEAAGRIRDLERALADVRDLERQRGEFWREATHDLRGSVGVVNGATAALNQSDVPEAKRERFLRMLQTSVGSLHALLSDLMSLARLEAGQERRRLERFDVAAVIGQLCANLQPLADERGLFLETEGPTTLTVEGDTVKIQRILQNLLLNALDYTNQGGVRVTWAERDAGGVEHWMLCVHDTGPGLQAGSVTPLAHALKRATDESQEMEEPAEASSTESSNQTMAPPASASLSVHPLAQRPRGEGIGLSIVKRLCELLDASLELETTAGQGTTFRVIFPRQYSTI